MKKLPELIGRILLSLLFGILSVYFQESCRSPGRPEISKEWYFGYVEDIQGETIIYHSPQGEADPALLVRSEDSNRYIEWETESLPERSSRDEITFVWMAGIDINTDSHSFAFFVNGEKQFTFANPISNEEKHWQLIGQDGVKLEYKITNIDRYGDFMGYMFLSVPVSHFPANQPLRLRVEGESAGSRSWFMIFKESLESELTPFSEQAILRDSALPKQSVRLEIVHLGDPLQAEVGIDDLWMDTSLELGLNVLRLSIPAVRRPRKKTVYVAAENGFFKKADILLRPVKEKDIYLLHHSHVDIGYTHTQEEVVGIQVNNLKRALVLAEQTEKYPEGSRFKWNTEVLWPVENFLLNEPPDSHDRFADAVRKGWIGLDALYANELTGLCRPEELFQLLASARSLSDAFGTKIEAAMITDIPGYTWGLVPVLAQSGVKYLSIGTNSSHRIGHLLSQWSDKPFYWLSPSGKERILCWVHGKGYSWFHTGLGYSELKKRLQEKPIFEYLSALEAADYPYDMIGVRYNIGSDNGPPDEYLADTVRRWNGKYSSPRLIIATTAEMFNDFENRYEGQIPVYRGDFTGYWEDGASSSAFETALNRHAAERLVQSEVLWALRAPNLYPDDRFRRAWRNVLLYDEHTWGSWNSISDPESEFTREQWTVKQSFALESDRLSRELERVAGTFAGKQTKINSLDVYNTSSWTRTDLVVIPENISLAGESVVDDQGRRIPTQRLSTGELAFVVHNIPSFSARRLFFKDEPALSSEGTARAWETGLSNGRITVHIDEFSGAIRSLKTDDLEKELVDVRRGLGLNDYLYVTGRNPENPRRNSRVTIRIQESGPIVASLMITSEAPGCRSLSRKIRLVDGIDRVDIFNRLDKEKILTPEGVHFAFPFLIPDGVMRLDVAWGIYRPEDDQLPGSNKNYFAVQRWVDVSNAKYGISWASPDAPLIEIDEIACDPVVFGWKKTVAPSQSFFSYVMNNYWETNYKASQDGLATFRYSLRPHGPFDSAAAEMFGQECSQSLVIGPADNNPPVESLLELESESIIITSMKPAKAGKALILRLFNAASTRGKGKVHWRKKPPGHIYLSDPFEERGEEVSGPIELPPFGLITLRAEFD